MLEGSASTNSGLQKYLQYHNAGHRKIRSLLNQLREASPDKAKVLAKQIRATIDTENMPSAFNSKVLMVEIVRDPQFSSEQNQERKFKMSLNTIFTDRLSKIEESGDLDTK